MRAAIRACVVGTVVIASRTATAATSSGGFKGGVNFAELWGVQSGLDYSSARAGFIGGGFIQSVFTPHAALRFEGLWLSSGGELEDGGTLELGYVEFPILLVVLLPAGSKATLNFFAGPTFGINTSAELKDANGISSDVDSVNGVEFGISLGFGLDYAISSMSFLLDVRYALGFTSVFADETHGGWPDVNNRGAGIMVGVGFPLGTAVQ